MKTKLLAIAIIMIAAVSCGNVAVQEDSNLKTLVVIDVQRDFFDPAGHLYVAGSEVLPEKISTLFDNYDAIVFTLDWHPGNHCSFAEQGGIWPAHCVEYSQGAGLPDNFEILLSGKDKKFYHYLKGQNKDKEEYGAFQDMTSEDEIFKVFAASESIDVCGIVGEYCVMESMKNICALGFKDKMTALLDYIACMDGGIAFGEYLQENEIAVR